MVASQKRFEWKPVYGEIPRGTPESLETAEQLRELARRKRRRNRLIGWFIALALAAAIGIAGWFAYRAYQDDQDQRAADRAARAATEATEAPGVLGEQDQVVELLDDLNSGGATSSAGGLLGAVDDARTVVDGVDEGAEAVDALTIDDVLPQPIVRLGRRLDDAEGHTRYVVDGRLFASDSPDEYARFLALAEALPQRDADAAELGLIPALQPAEIGVAIQVDGDRLIGAVIVSPDLDLYVVYP